MIDERDVKEMLRRRADSVPTVAVDTPTAVRQARRRLFQNGVVATVAAVAVVVAMITGVDAIHTAPVPADRPSGDLGIFAPVAGRIVYENGEGGDLGYSSGLWAVDPSGPADTTDGPRVADDVVSTLVPLNLEGGVPLAWSRDGTELLFKRGTTQDLFPEEYLYILHADGSETQLNSEPMYLADPGATISPDGQHVVFAAQAEHLGLWLVDADGGGPASLPYPPCGLPDSPTFSPDGSQIAYLVYGDCPAGRPHEYHVWVADADGSNSHEILADDKTQFACGGLQWSPAGDRLACTEGGTARNGDVDAIYTFAPDGSNFTRVIEGGTSPYWSPDGTQIAFTQTDPGGTSTGLAIAEADGSNARAFGFAASGPWHPGTPADDAPTTVETPAPDETPTPVEVLNFTGGPDGAPGDLVAVSSQTGQSRVLVSGLPVVQSARWSADRRWVAYEDDAGLWVVGPDLEPRPVTSGSVPLSSWAPDGARLAILEGSSLSILDVTTESTTELGTVTGDVTTAPVWSPDGTRLVYGARGGTVSSVDVGSGERSVLVEIPGDDLDSMDEMAWSPDGTWLAISYDVVPGNARLYLVDADGSDVRVLCDDNGDDDECGEMAWSPDGDRLAYLEYVGGLGPRILTQTPHGASPVLVGKADFGSCAAGGCGLPVWSPDGSMIAMHGGYDDLNESVDPIFLAVDADGTGNVVPIDGMTYQSWYDGAYDLSWFRTWW